MAKEAKMEERRKVIADLKAHAIKKAKPEDSIFYYPPTHIVKSTEKFIVLR